MEPASSRAMKPPVARVAVAPRNAIAAPSRNVRPPNGVNGLKNGIASSPLRLDPRRPFLRCLLEGLGLLGEPLAQTARLQRRRQQGRRLPACAGALNHRPPFGEKLFLVRTHGRFVRFPGNAFVTRHLDPFWMRPSAGSL